MYRLCSKYERETKSNEDFELYTKANLNVDVVNSKILGLEKTFIEKQDSMTTKRIYKKDFNTDLKSSIIKH